MFTKNHTGSPHVERLKAQVKNLQAANALLGEKVRMLQEENKFCAEVLARLRLQGQLDLARVQQELTRLGIGPKPEEPKT